MRDRKWLRERGIIVRSIVYRKKKTKDTRCAQRNESSRQQYTIYKLTLTASKVDPMAIKLEIKRAQYHTLRGDLRAANVRCRRVDAPVVEVAADVE